MIVTINTIAFIAGEWEGTGRAEYPTIAPLDYKENLAISLNKKDSVLHYEQRTWVKSSDQRNDEPIFWESGFIIDKGEGMFMLVSAQKSGRVETLNGTAEQLDGGRIKLMLDSVSIHNDERMVQSRRILHLSHDALHYEHAMSTTTNKEMKRHLSAQLKRRKLSA